jgi:hypothetical protein
METRPCGHIDTRTGYGDYLTGILLTAAPWLLNFSDAGNAAAISGSRSAWDCSAYALRHDQDDPMPAHLGTDMLVGAVLIVSPWLFGFADEVCLPHVLVESLEIGVAV